MYEKCFNHKFNNFYNMDFHHYKLNKNWKSRYMSFPHTRSFLFATREFALLWSFYKLNKEKLNNKDNLHKSVLVRTPDSTTWMMGLLLQCMGLYFRDNYNYSTLPRQDSNDNVVQHTYHFSYNTHSLLPRQKLERLIKRTPATIQTLVSFS